MEYFLNILGGMAVVIPSYLLGFKLRVFVPQNKRFMVGFFTAAFVLTLFLLASFIFEASNIIRSGLGTAFAIGFMLGIAGSPQEKMDKRDS